MLKLICKLWLRFRVYWSNLKNKNDLKDCDVDGVFETPASIAEWMNRFYHNFEYTPDGWEDLFDSMRFPAECYQRITSKVFRDDCDGYHAAMYHIAKKKGFECCLLTYIPTEIKEGHTVVLIKYLNRYWILDYNKVLVNNTLKEVLDDTLRRRKVELVAYNLVDFDYDKSKYVLRKEKI